MKSRTPSSGLSLVHFDPFCFYFDKKAEISRLLFIFGRATTISFLYTIPNCTEEQQYIILLWSIILGNCSFHWQVSILVSKIPLLLRNLIQIWKFLGGGSSSPSLSPCYGPGSSDRVVTRYMGSGIKGHKRAGIRNSRDLESQHVGSGSAVFFMDQGSG